VDPAKAGAGRTGAHLWLLHRQPCLSAVPTLARGTPAFHTSWWYGESLRYTRTPSSLKPAEAHREKSTSCNARPVGLEARTPEAAKLGFLSRAGKAQREYPFRLRSVFAKNANGSAPPPKGHEQQTNDVPEQPMSEYQQLDKLLCPFGVCGP